LAVHFETDGPVAILSGPVRSGLLRQPRQRPPRVRDAGHDLPGYIGCIVIQPDGRRRLARAVPDPLAQPKAH
jgi:hypothetical protein